MAARLSNKVSIWVLVYVDVDLGLHRASSPSGSARHLPPASSGLTLPILPRLCSFHPNPRSWGSPYEVLHIGHSVTWSREREERINIHLNQSILKLQDRHPWRVANAKKMDEKAETMIHIFFATFHYTV